MKKYLCLLLVAVFMLASVSSSAVSTIESAEYTGQRIIANGMELYSDVAIIKNVGQTGTGKYVDIYSFANALGAVIDETETSINFWLPEPEPVIIYVTPVPTAVPEPTQEPETTAEPEPSQTPTPTPQPSGITPTPTPPPTGTQQTGETTPPPTTEPQTPQPTPEPTQQPTPIPTVEPTPYIGNPDKDKWIGQPGDPSKGIFYPVK